MLPRHRAERRNETQTQAREAAAGTCAVAGSPWRAGAAGSPGRAGAAGVHGRDAPALVEQVPPAAKSQQGFLKASWSLEKDTAEVVLRPGPLRRPSPVALRNCEQFRVPRPGGAREGQAGTLGSHGNGWAPSGPSPEPL